MVRKSTILLLIIIFLAAITVSAQQRPRQINSDNYRAVHWSVENGLASDIANIMLKDVKGFLWVGSLNGELCRFDGATFKKYKPSTHIPGNINSDFITGLVEDSLNNIWVGTAKGMSRFDINTDTFKNIVSGIGSTSPHKSIVPFWSTSSHVYCLEAGFQIAAYNINSLKRKIIATLTKSDIVQRIIPAINYTIVDTDSNSIWMLGGDSSSGYQEGGGVVADLPRQRQQTLLSLAVP
jgi:hypothetical protein